MTEYLINVGDFNIIVLPERRQYFILGEDEGPSEVETQFIDGKEIAYTSMKPLWFQYGQDEEWKDFAGKSYRLGEDVKEDELIEKYVLKKFNFGSLVAVRTGAGGKVKVFKRDMLHAKV
jgi:hypothetical protein